jgi:transposase InsO family protein
MRPDYPIALRCRVFDVSRSGFYGWFNRKPSRRQQTDEQLKVAIKAAHRQSRETYRVRRMQPEFEEQGFAAGRDRIGRLRKELGLHCKPNARIRPRPTRAMTSQSLRICWSSGSNRLRRTSTGLSLSRMCRLVKAGFTSLA